MMTDTNNAARTHANTTINDIDWNDAAISVLNWGARGTVGIVRPTVSGSFAVIELLGAGRKRIVKVLPTLERARAYNFACARN
jgi:hypothetical protein